MMILHILYDVTISLYALSICGYFIDFLDNNRRVKWAAFWLLSIVWVLQLVIFIYKGAITDEFPVVTTTGGLFLLSWLIVTLSLVMNRLLKLDFIVFFSNLAGVMIMTVSLFKPSDQVALHLSDNMTSDLLIIHISMALIAYALFTLSFILSMMYSLEYRLLKQKKWGNRLVRLGSLSKIESYAARAVLVGVPLLLISLLLGMYRAYVAVPDFQWFDPKVTLSFIVLFIYSLYIYMRFAKHIYGKTLAYYNAIGFLMVIINVFISNEVTNFHLW